MGWLRLAGSSFASRPIEQDFARLWRALREIPEVLVLGLGVFLRLFVYFQNRGYFMDEGSLLGNIEGKPILDFSQPLSSNQLAPLGFLIVERACVSRLGDSRFVSRLFPLASGIPALFLFGAWLAASCPVGRPCWHLSSSRFRTT